jgi:hypothetical protein
MKLILLPACAVLVVLVAPVRAQQDESPTPEIAQCLRDNAAAVEAAEPDITKATDFLVLDACAVPIAKEQQRQNAQRTQTAAERNRALCRDRVAQQKQQDQSAVPGRTVRIYENCDLNYDNAMANTNAMILPIINLPQRPPAVVAMAAKLILDLRVAHNKSRP